MSTGTIFYRSPRNWGLGCLGVIALALLLVIVFIFARATAPANNGPEASRTPTATLSEVQSLQTQVAVLTHGTPTPRATFTDAERDLISNVLPFLNGDVTNVNLSDEEAVATAVATQLGTYVPQAQATATMSIEQRAQATVAARQGTQVAPDTQSFVDGTIRISGFPVTSVPARWGNGVVQTENTSPIDSAAWILANPGVLSADDIADCEGNMSCVWSGGASVDNLMENPTANYSCPEGGYIKTTYPEGTISALDFTVSVDAAADTNYTFLVRCPYAEGEGDNSVSVRFETEHPGDMKPMRYPVPYRSGGFFSFAHLEEDLNNGKGISANHDDDGSDNCGNFGCAHSFVILVDYNHGTVGVYEYHGPSQWELVYTNAVRPTPAQ